MTDSDCSPQARRLSEKADEIAQSWAAGIDPAQSLGHRHHLVPAMYLRAFARGDQLLVRRIPEHRPITCNIGDLAQKDFYTILADDPGGGPPRPDARIEQALQLVEGPAARVLALLRNPLLARRRLTDPERDQLTHFIAFQLIWRWVLSRGMEDHRSTDVGMWGAVLSILFLFPGKP